MIWIAIAAGVVAYLIVKSQKRRDVEPTRVGTQHGRFVDGKFVASDR